ncbi:MAG: hypothetical protein QM813_08455 [Verrucomicrobiota bacterium]
MNATAPKFIFALLVTLAYTLGTMTHLRAVSRSDAGQPDEGAFKKLLGDGRRLFSGQFVEMADVYFHSGMYPSIFDRAATKASTAVTSAVEQHGEEDHDHHEHDANGNCIHDAAHADHQSEEAGSSEPDDHDAAHVKAMTPGAAQNWLEGFIRRFRITEHSHLAQGDEREILPWLKIAIELDPQAIDTYTTAAYWLRAKLNRPDQAEKVLREGIRNNSTNPELLFEMGLLYKENRKDRDRARNIWRYAAKCWLAQGEAVQAESHTYFSKILSNLGELEQEAGNAAQAISYFEQAKPFSPRPEGLQKKIDELRAKLPVQ